MTAFQKGKTRNLQVVAGVMISEIESKQKLVVAGKDKGVKSGIWDVSLKLDNKFGKVSIDDNRRKVISNAFEISFI